jgi:hypothetical protein
MVIVVPPVTVLTGVAETWEELELVPEELVADTT